MCIAFIACQTACAQTEPPSCVYAVGSSNYAILPRASDDPLPDDFAAAAGAEPAMILGWNIAMLF